MSKKLLNDLAGILAELNVSYKAVEDLADELEFMDILDKHNYEDFLNTASNAPSAGECGC